MSLVKKTITVTEQQEQWVKSQIAMGDYASDSEVIRDLIRKEQTLERQARIDVSMKKHSVTMKKLAESERQDKIRFRAEKHRNTIERLFEL